MKRSNKCGKCGVDLTLENCNPSRFNHAGPCRSCKNARRRDRYKNEPGFKERDSAKHAKRWKNMSAEGKRLVADRNFYYKYGISVIDFSQKLRE
jgi:hypothetical protein